MRRESMSFSDFEEQWINAPFGYVPVHVAIIEDDDGVFRPGVDMDMLVNWRLGDGKVLFLTVEVETPEQLDIIMAWCREAADWLRDEIVKTTNDPWGHRKLIKWSDQ